MAFLSSKTVHSIDYEKGDFKRAEPLYQRALMIRDKTLGALHPDLVKPLSNLAETYRRMGDFERAEPLYRRALAISEKALGPKHPTVATALLGFGSLYERKGDTAEAVRIQTRLNDIREYNLALILATGSEEQKRLYMNTLADETDITVSRHFRIAAGDAQAARLSLTTVLRRKGRVLDAMSDSIEALRRRAKAEDRVLLEELSATRSKLARLVLNGPGKNDPAQHQAEVSRLEAEVQRLEAEASIRSAEFRAQTQPVNIERIQQAIPADAALVELVSYRPFDVTGRTNKESFDEPSYAAYVLRNKGAPVWVKLGEAAPTDAAVARLRNALRNPESKNVKQLARTLDEKMMRPIRKLLGETRNVFLSPDGALNLVPFSALVDEQNQYLVKRYSFTYLTSGRDLLRLQVPSQSRTPPVVVANPLFNSSEQPTHNQASQTHQSDESRGSLDFNKVRFSPLAGTAEEAKALERILPNAQVMTGKGATEVAVKKVSGPLVLHVATHGFFLADQRTATADTRGLKLGASINNAARPQKGQDENPLLRSGLALAGANQRRGGGGEDGILTALEVAGLDLWGTKLVVLSACETGVGEVKNGDGVYGLRRALVLAGAQSQVMSLWQVSDTATRDIMIEYYKRLEAGEGRTEALRQVQLDMLTSGRQRREGLRRGLGSAVEAGRNRVRDRRHPFYWASFIQSGEWKSMQGKPLN